ncbi:hypothetical protein [Iodidimonas sp. SYSU 1G8]|uniref:hypothetical protein n=1 Tax=Iodidimonas sp. SYSU 1G8 TaxID=3133967 RepID=UPI0031FE54DF
MNPELLRNVWHELTWRRVIAMPLILGVILWVPSSFDGVTETAGFLFIVFTVFWGTRQAADAVASEVADSTWDWQRLSTLSAWQLTWGKLVGATLFSWYGALICLGVRFVALVPDHGVVAMVHVTLYLAAGALMGQAVAFLLGLQAVRLRGHRTRSGTLMSQMLGILTGLVIISSGSFLPGGLLEWLDALKLAPVVGWYGLTFPSTTVATVSLALYLGWALLGAQRLMMRELSYRTRPWTWPIFVLFTCFYIAGFEPAEPTIIGDVMRPDLAARLVVATGVAAVLTYASLFWDDKDPVVFRRLIRLARARDWSTFAAHTPTWFVSFAITAVLAILLLLVGGGGAMGGVTVWAAVIGGLLFMLRDIGINLYFWLSPSPARANLITLIVLGLLYWVGPGFTEFDPDTMFLFIPFAPGHPVSVICAGLAQVGFVILLLVRRWRARFVLANA